MSDSGPWPLQPIAYLRSPFRQKFAIPRQPNLVRAALGELEFVEGFRDPNLLRGLEGFSHLWLLFVFHATAAQGWSATIAPPRLGGDARVGVFASRSPFRPNGLGLSVVERGAISQVGSRLCLQVHGVDLLDGTPIVDIKPYLPYADCVPDASAGYAGLRPGAEVDDSASTVVFTGNTRTVLEEIHQTHPHFEALVRGVLQQDPRPAHQARGRDTRDYAMWLYDYNVRWRVLATGIDVFAIEALPAGPVPWQTPGVSE